jgi:hypothetical protein
MSIDLRQPESVTSFEDELLARIETPEDRLKRQLEDFSDFWRRSVGNYGIKQQRYTPSWLECSRIAYLASCKLTQILQKPIGQDVSCVFYLWAKKNRLTCAKPISECEMKKNGKLKKTPSYPHYYSRVFTGLYFGRFVQVAEEITLPKRFPLIRRLPVIRTRIPDDRP